MRIDPQVVEALFVSVSMKRDVGRKTSCETVPAKMAPRRASEWPVAARRVIHGRYIPATYGNKFREVT